MAAGNPLPVGSQTQPDEPGKSGCGSKSVTVCASDRLLCQSPGHGPRRVPDPGTRVPGLCHTVSVLPTPEPGALEQPLATHTPRHGGMDTAWTSESGGHL